MENGERPDADERPRAALTAVAPESLRRSLGRGGGTSWQREDWILATAAASVLFGPPTFGVSLLAGPVAWWLALRDTRRIEAVRARVPERIVWARRVGVFSSAIVAIALFVVTIAGIAALAGRTFGGAAAVMALIGIPAVVAVGVAWLGSQALRRRRRRREQQRRTRALERAERRP